MLSRLHTLWIAVLLGLLPYAAAHAGNGKFNSTNRAFDFCVSIRFDATTQEMQRLATLFEAASGVIFETTNGQHQFGTITAYNDKIASKNADVWILDGKGSSFASPNGYGIPGRSIILYYDSLIGKNGVKPNSEYVLAHAFSHFAYGILDEYHDGNGSPAECLAGPTATHVCLLEDYKSALNSGTKAKMWCLSANHDADLDTAQSAYHHKSCWETAKARFPDLVIPNSIDYVSPTFDLNNNEFVWIAGASTRRFVLIIDHSGSMGSHNSPTSALSLAKEAAKLFVDLTNPGDRLGVVEFDDTAPAPVVWNITNMSPSNKDKAKLAIDGIVSGGGTGIGEGLKTGLEMIDVDGGGGCIQAMILLSDGYHNSGVHPDVVVPGMIAKAIPVFTIGLGDSVDTALMQKIASSTGGRYFAAPNANQLNGIFAQISAELSDGGVIASGSNFGKSGQIKQDSFVVDAKTSVATFIITWNSLNSTLAFVLKGPNGITIATDVKPPNFPGDKPHVTVNYPDFEPGNSAVTIKISKPVDMEGAWTLTFVNKNPLTNTSTVNYEYQVLSNDSDILIAGAPDKLAYQANEVMTICSTVVYEAPVTNVDVRAAITRPDGSIFEAQLKDDGSITSGDPFANDGNFAYRFNGWNQNGVYLVDVDVNGTTSAQTVQGEAIDDKTDPIAVKNFHRHTEFAVSVTGAQTIDTTAHFVNFANLEYNKDNSLLNKAVIEGLLDLDVGLVDPKKDSLLIIMNNGNSIGHNIDPSSLIAIDAFHYIFSVDPMQSDTTPAEFSGYIDLFKKNTSAGGYQITSQGPKIDLPVTGEPISIQFKWGEFDETVSVFPKVKTKSGGITTAKYDSKKHDCSTDVFYVTSAKVKFKETLNQDSLTLRGRFSSDYDPSAGTTTLKFGNFTTTAANWTTSPTDPGKFDFSSLNGLTGAKVEIHVDTELRELTVEAKGLNLKGFPNPAVVELSCGGFSEKCEITLATKKGSLSY